VAPSSTASDESWLKDFEPNRDDHDRGVVHVCEAAQVSARLAPRLRTPEAEAAWTAATSSEYLHRVRRHGLDVSLTNGIWPAAHDAGGSSIKARVRQCAREAINELYGVAAVSAWEDHVRAGRAESASPGLVMPLIVEPKPSRPGKFRFIHDCRHLSKLLGKWPFKIDNLTNFVKQQSLMDKLFSIVIESAYIHVEVAPRHRTFLGFRLEGTTYVYNVLPFGLTTSASVFCAFTAVTVKAVRNSGLVSVLIVYVGDFGGSVGQERDSERMNEVLRIALSFGWVLTPSKLNVDLVCHIKLLGFMLNTETMCIGTSKAGGSSLSTRPTKSSGGAHTCRCASCANLQAKSSAYSWRSGWYAVCEAAIPATLGSRRGARRRLLYRGFTTLGRRAAGETALFAYQLNSAEDQPMHKHKR
jgi:hypothetical protein